MISELKGHWQGVQLDPTKGFQVFAIGRQAAAFLISIILVKSHWSTMEIGAYELWLFFGLVLSFAWLTGALQSFSSLYPPMSEMEKAKFITSTYLNTIAVVGVLAVALALGQQYYVPGLFQLEEVPYLSLALLYLLLHTTSYLSPHILLVRRLHNQFIPYTLIYMIGHVMAVSVPLLLAGGLREVLYGLIVFAILEQVYLLFLVRQHGSWSWSPHLWAKLSRLALPLGLYAAVGSFPQIFDAWLVSWWYGDLDTFAIFRYGARELPGALAMASAFSTAMIVSLATDLKKGMERLRLGVRRLLHIFFPISILLMLVSPLLFRWIYDETFVTSAAIFNVYLLLMLSRWLFPHSVFLAMKHTTVLLCISLAEMIINIVISIVLINHFGLIGVAFGTVIAYILEKVILVIFTKRKYNIGFFEFVPPRIFITYSFLLIVAFVASIFIY